MKEQNGSTVLVTGGTSGIGFELARQFAQNGYRLIIVARDETELQSTTQLLEKEYGVDVLTISKDLSEPDAGFELYEEIKAKGETVDILVNNAAQGQYGLFAETDIRSQLEIIGLNIDTVVALTHCYLQDMLARGNGKILNVSSVASRFPGPWQAVYHGTKAFVQSFTEAVRHEVKDKGIVITALLPGVTDTDFFNKADMNDSKVVQDKDQMADPADVAKDGYEALMRGDDMVVSGFKNKMQTKMAAVTPDATLAAQIDKMQQPYNIAIKTKILNNQQNQLHL